MGGEAVVEGAQAVVGDVNRPAKETGYELLAATTSGGRLLLQPARARCPHVPPVTPA